MPHLRDRTSRTAKLFRNQRNLAVRIPTEWISPDADVAEVELTFDGDVIVIRPLARRQAGQILERLANEVDRDSDLRRELADWEVPADPLPEPVRLGLDL